MEVAHRRNLQFLIGGSGWTVCGGSWWFLPGCTALKITWCRGGSSAGLDKQGFESIHTHLHQVPRALSYESSSRLTVPRSSGSGIAHSCPDTTKTPTFKDSWNWLSWIVGAAETWRLFRKARFEFTYPAWQVVPLWYGGFARCSWPNSYSKSFYTWTW